MYNEGPSQPTPTQSPRGVSGGAFPDTFVPGGAGRTRTPAGGTSVTFSRTSQSWDKGMTHTGGQWGDTE